MKSLTQVKVTQWSCDGPAMFLDYHNLKGMHSCTALTPNERNASSIRVQTSTTYSSPPLPPHDHARTDEQLNLSQMQVQGQNELVETLCRRLQLLEKDYAALSASIPPNTEQPNPTSSGMFGGMPGSEDANAAPADGEPTVPRRRASTGPTLSVPSNDPYFGSSPGMLRRMSSIAGPVMGNSGGFGGPPLPAANIDMSDLNNLVRLVLSVDSQEGGAVGESLLVDLRVVCSGCFVNIAGFSPLGVVPSSVRCPSCRRESSPCP